MASVLIMVFLYLLNIKKTSVATSTYNERETYISDI